MKCEIRSKWFDEHVEDVQNDSSTFEEDMEQLVYDDECGWGTLYHYDEDFHFDHEYYYWWEQTEIAAELSAEYD